MFHQNVSILQAQGNSYSTSLAIS
uniref:Uncharacterized protein n=1 Tax=Arundo donax TaxID=35708 RepID=A0A0A8Z0P6_ARUDO